MRQDQEALAGQPGQHRVGDLAGREHLAGGRNRPGARLTGLQPGHQQRGVDSHRTQHADPDIALGVGVGDPLGQRHRGVLGHRVRRVAGRGEQAGGRGGVQQVPAAGRDHRRQHRPGGIDMGQHVHLPGPLPHPVLGGQPGTGGQPRIGAEQVDPAVLGQHPPHAGTYRGLVGDVQLLGPTVAAGCPRRSAGHRGDRPAVEVGEHQLGRARRGEPAAELGADAAAGTGQHDHRARDIHQLPPSSASTSCQPATSSGCGPGSTASTGSCTPAST